jgi:transglutaminase-like putative cysteine protease
MINLQPLTNNYQDYLVATPIIDYTHRDIQLLADGFKSLSNDQIEQVKNAFEFVRDAVAHSCDIKGNIVTCNASEVLKHRQGICFAKSHLLAAILRYLNIPTGFCYQKLVFDDQDPSYHTLHGLNGVYLPELNKWIRLDPRGNKPGINAQFQIHREQLAFVTRKHWQEIDYPLIYSQPNPAVIKALNTYPSVEELINHLPQDIN